MEKYVIIAIDFDGTIVTHKYPEIGAPVAYAIETMISLQQSGHQLILYTMRSDDKLQEAVDYCKSCGVEFWGVNENPDQRHWTRSPKVYAQVYIDDAALGCPLLGEKFKNRPYVDWREVRKYFRMGEEFWN